MDQVSSRSGLGSDEVTDETTSLVDDRWSSDDDESFSLQGQCLAAPQPPLLTYKQKYDEFKRMFRELPVTERLLVDYPCALQRDILLQGRLYLTEKWLCFYSNVFRGTKVALTLKDITTMSREKTARLIPNAIQVCVSTEKFFFTSFSAREKSYQTIFRMWQNTLMNQSLTSSEFWPMVKQHYGHDLGLSHEEMDSFESSMHNSLTVRPTGDDGFVRLERPPSLRLPVADHGPLETSTPQGEDLPSPAGSQNNSSNMQESRNSSTSRRSPVPSLERMGSERTSKPSPITLDLNANVNGVSELSGSESNEEVEERANLSQVQGRVYLNKVFHISASKMFELLFTDSGFIRRFMGIRKIIDPSFTAWQTDASGNKKRSLNYTVSISNPLIGKFSTATENQTLYKESKEGQNYLVDCEVYAHDVPYHDYFYTHNRYCITSNSKKKCRLRVSTDVKYKKQPWGLVKSFITRNSWSNIEDYFRQLEMELLEEEAELNQGGHESGKMGGLRRRRRAYSRTLQEHIKPSMQYRQDPEQLRDEDMGPMEMKDPFKWNTTMLVAVMSFILFVLTMMNLGLFYKLSAMEDVAHRMYLSTKHRLRDRSEPSLSQGPVYKSRDELHLLKTVLQDSINLLEQLRISLVALQQNFALSNQTAAGQ